MNKDIKFRAWDELRKIMYSSKCINLLLHFDGKLQSTDDKGNILGTINTPEMIIMQYTGLKDKNGKEIYEGDILKVKTSWYNSNKDNAKDRFNSCIRGETFWSVEHKIFNNFIGFRVYGIDRRFNKPLNPNMIINCDAEVIGNIYENPELLEVANGQH